ncbi:hypothetical protein FACS1894162_2380 [Bacteroidia bacterium]|nr:hypothetical protein FACS1894162_2380 [Bacteroidia bacterium]
MDRKIYLQIAGIEIAEKILKDQVFAGLTSMDSFDIRMAQRRISELRAYPIEGILSALEDTFLELSNVQNHDYRSAIRQINFTYSLMKKGLDYLAIRKSDPNTPPDLETNIEELLGRKWKIAELKNWGLWEENTEILQLSFNGYYNAARKEWVDEAIWINLKTGKLYKNQNCRPCNLSKRFTTENSVFNVLQLVELYIYPGRFNPKIRWSSSEINERLYTPDDLQLIRSFAANDYAQTMEAVKKSVQNPLNDPHPVILVSLEKALQNDNDDDIDIQDALGARITVRDSLPHYLPSTAHLKNLLSQPFDRFTLLLMINDLQDGLLSAQALAIVTPQQLIRLMY